MRDVSFSCRSRNPVPRSSTPARARRATEELAQKLFAAAAGVAYSSPEDAEVLFRAGAQRVVSALAPNDPARLVVEYPVGVWSQKAVVSP